MNANKTAGMTLVALVAAAAFSGPALAQSKARGQLNDVRGQVGERYDPYALWIGQGSVESGSCYVSREQALIGGQLRWRTLYMCRDSDR